MNKIRANYGHVAACDTVWQPCCPPYPLEKLQPKAFCNHAMALLYFASLHTGVPQTLFRGFNYANYPKKLIITTQGCPEVAFIHNKSHKIFPAHSSCLVFHSLRWWFLILRRVYGQPNFFLVRLVFFLCSEASLSLYPQSPQFLLPLQINKKLEKYNCWEWLSSETSLDFYLSSNMVIIIPTSPYEYKYVLS